MIQPELLNDAALKKLLRIISEKEFLFKQGERGNTMFIIIEGQVELTQKTLHQVRQVDTMGPGDILGEKAVLTDSPYKRTLTGQAKTEVAVLEFDAKSLKMIQGKLPNFTHQMLRMVSKRLDKETELIGILQLREEADRLIQYILHCCKYSGTKGTRGIEFNVTTAKIQSNILVSEQLIEKVVSELLKHQLLIRTGEGYIVPDDHALLSYLPSLKERIAA